MNFSKINYRSFLGRLLRFPLRIIPKGMVLPILQGCLRGKKWIVGSGEHGYWLGSYELRKRIAFEREVKSGSVIYDIGANVGYFSLVSAVLAGAEGHVYSFEPLPRNVDFLHRHIQINNMKNITVLEAAVSEQQGEAFFDLGASSAMGHLSDSGAIKVRLVSLDRLLACGELRPPDFVKLDVEGAEFAALCGARKMLETYRPVLFLDTHDREAHQNTIALLRDLDYRFEILDGKPMSETKELIAKPLLNP